MTQHIALQSSKMMHYNVLAILSFTRVATEIWKFCKARFLFDSPSNWMNGIKYSIFKMATVFLLRFFVFVTVMSSIQLNLQIMGSSDTPVLQCIIPHGKRQLQSLVTHHRSSSGTCKDCGKFHNTFSISNDHKLIFLLRTLHFVHSCWLNTIAVQLEIFQLRIFLTC